LPKSSKQLPYKHVGLTNFHPSATLGEDRFLFTRILDDALIPKEFAHGITIEDRVVIKFSWLENYFLNYSTNTVRNLLKDT